MPLAGEPATGFDGERKSILLPDEQARAARFRFDADRARWVRARTALRLILSGQTGLRPEEIQFELGPYGKPALAGGVQLEFNLSHAGDWAMVAVTHGVPVGIDIERIRENLDMGALLRRLGVPVGSADGDLLSTPAGLFTAWTRREAMSKALGGALMNPPAGDFRLCDLVAPAGYTAALALIGRDPRVRRQDVLVLSIGTK